MLPANGLTRLQYARIDLNLTWKHKPWCTFCHAQTHICSYCSHVFTYIHPCPPTYLILFNGYPQQYFVINGYQNQSRSFGVKINLRIAYFDNNYRNLRKIVVDRPQHKTEDRIYLQFSHSQMTATPIIIITLLRVFIRNTTVLNK